MTDVAAGPLAGITVLALEQAVAAPFATRQLADLGARVIKVERVDTGDFARHYDDAVEGQSSYFVWLNRGKQSITVDAKAPGDRALLEAILAKADVFVQNLAPGAAERLDLGVARLRQTYPRLITCSISGYGATGPYANKKAYDLLVQCEAALVSLTGSPDEPAKVGISIADISAGMYAYTAVLTALYNRERTGSGTSLSVSMLEALGEWMQQPALFTRYSGRSPQRSGPRHASIAPYGPYRVADGSTVFLAIQNEREWDRFCREILHQPQLITDERFTTNSARVANQDVLAPIIEAAFATRTAAEVMAALNVAAIAEGQLRSMEEFLEHPQLIERGRWRPVRTPAGTVQSLKPPVDIEGYEPELGAVPALGEHNQLVRSEFAVTSHITGSSGPNDLL